MMSEDADPIVAGGRGLLTLLQAALGVAEQLVRQWAQQAERAARESEQRRRAMDRQVAAERDSAAVQWGRASSRELYRQPVQLADAMASAGAWRDLDPRAARAWDVFQRRLERAGVDAGALEQARGDRDERQFGALALALQRADKPGRDRSGPGEGEADQGPSGSADPLAEQRLQRDADHQELVNRVLGSSLGSEVISSPNWGYVQDTLLAAEQAGLDLDSQVRDAAKERDFGDARDPAAVLNWRMRREVTRNEAAQPAEAVPAELDASTHRAAQLVTQSQFGAQSMLQRRLGVERGEAARLLDALEQHGVVGPAEGSKARLVRMSPPEYAAYADQRGAVEADPNLDQPPVEHSPSYAHGGQPARLAGEAIPRSTPTSQPSRGDPEQGAEPERARVIWRGDQRDPDPQSR